MHTWVNGCAILWGTERGYVIWGWRRDCRKSFRVPEGGVSAVPRVRTSRSGQASEERGRRKGETVRALWVIMLHGVKLPDLGMGLGGRQKSQSLPYQGNTWEASSKMGRRQWDHIYKDPYNSCQHRQLELDCGIMAWPSIDHSGDVLEQFQLPVRI